MIGTYPVVTLCGSTRFKEEFYRVQKELTLQGKIVISVGLFGHGGDAEVWENMDEGTLTKTKEMLDDMHKRKIDMADEIFVINVDGYIGDSTRSEIEYAKETGKGIRYLEEPEEMTFKEEKENEVTWMVMQASVFLYGSTQIVADLTEDGVELTCSLSIDGQTGKTEKTWKADKEAFFRMEGRIREWLKRNEATLLKTEEPNEYRVDEEKKQSLNGWVFACGDRFDNRILFVTGNLFTTEEARFFFTEMEQTFPGTERFFLQ